MVAISTTRIVDGDGELLCTLQPLDAGKYHVLRCAKPASELRPNRIVYLWESKTTLMPNPNSGRGQQKDETKDLHKGSPHIILAFYRDNVTEDRVLILQPT